VIIPAGGAATQDFTLRENPIRLSDLVVTATRDEERNVKIPANIGVVGQADIMATRPHHSAEIVNRVPGVLNINLGGEGSVVALRLPINYSAVYGYLEDGIPIRSTGFFNHNALYEINVPGAERVEVFKGPASALYGSDAIGGVFNVLTRPPSTTPDLEFFGEGGQSGYERTLVSASNTWGSNGVRGDLNLMHFGGWRDGANQERQTGTVRWDHMLQDARLKTVVTVTNINSPGDGGSDVPPSDFENSPSTNYTPIAFRKVQAVRWSTAYERQDGPSSYELTAYARYNRLNLLPSWQLTYDPQVWDSHNRSLGFMTKYRRAFGWGNAIFGADFDYSPGDNVEDQIIPTTTASYVFNSYTTGQRQYDYNVTFKGASPYAQVEVALVTGLHLSAGLRFDQLGYAYDNLLSVLDTGAHRRPASTSVWYSHLSPKVGITYDLTSAVNVYASYRNGFRVPSEEQLFVQGSASNSVGLQPVKANSFEAGVRARAGTRVSLEASAYTMDITDDIVDFYNTATFTSEVSNAGKTRHRGVEAGMKVALSEQLRLEGAYAYVRSRYVQWVTATGTDYSGNQMEAAPRHIGNARLVYAPAPRSEFSLEWDHVGWYYEDPENLHKYNGYDVLNLQGTTPAAHGFALVGRLSNLTNTRYAVTASYNPFVPADQRDRFTPGMPRTIYLGLQYRGGR
jgi:outer membrane receptor protein involved in Fe transport